MKRKLFPIIMILSAIVMLSGCFGRTVVGTGPMTSRSFEVEEFTSISTGGACTVTYRQSEDFLVTIEMQENLFEHLELNVEREGTLDIGFNRGLNITDGNTPRIYIYAPNIEGIDFSGAVKAADWDPIYGQSFFIDVSGAADITLSMEVNTLDIEASGAIDIELSGSADTANIELSGAGNISAENLQTRSAQIETSGSSYVGIAVSERLDVIASGASNVRYIGNPTVTEDISGASSVRSR